MYLCLDCGLIFDESKVYFEQHGFDEPPYEEWCGCPRCGGAYVRARKCNCCGEYIKGDFVLINTNEAFCENCYTAREVEDDIYDWNS